ncbi:MAG: FG-GAP-like repeat-containing protein [Proteobacteria bacterium]|nr:FG-GAP-like repeat-containing protein [Pseudomonadota bacterium]
MKGRRLHIIALVVSLGLLVAYLIVTPSGRTGLPVPEYDMRTLDAVATLSGGLRFHDSTLQAGILRPHIQHSKTISGLHESLGAGACALDYDLDGWVDLLVLNGSGTTHFFGRPSWWQTQTNSLSLYRNNRDGTFTESAAAAGLISGAWTMGCASADLDSDGDPDVLISAYGNNELWRNNGDSTFTDISETAGITRPNDSASISNDGVGGIYSGQRQNTSIIEDGVEAGSSGSNGRALITDVSETADISGQHKNASTTGVGKTAGVEWSHGRASTTGVGKTAGVEWSNGHASTTGVGKTAGVEWSHGRALITDVSEATDSSGQYGGASNIDADMAAGGAGRGWGTSVGVADVDGDGRLDLYFGRYLDFITNSATLEEHSGYQASVEENFNPALHQGQPNQLWINQGGLVFSEQAASWGVANAQGRSLSAAFADLNGDEYPDLIVANDRDSPNKIYLNDDGERFVDISTHTRAGFTDKTTSITTADFDGSGGAEILLTTDNTLLPRLYGVARDQDGLGFGEVGQVMGLHSGVSQGLSHWGGLAADFNLDGWTDIFIANGHHLPDSLAPKTSSAQANTLLLNNHGIAFENHSRLLGTHTYPFQSSRCALTADFNNDGAPDIYISQNNDLGQLLINNTAPQHWLGIELKAVGFTTQAAEITVEFPTQTPRANKTQRYQSHQSFLCTSDPRTVFALPATLPTTASTNAAAAADAAYVVTAIVRWPDGRRDEFRDLLIGRYYRISRDAQGVHLEGVSAAVTGSLLRPTRDGHRLQIIQWLIDAGHFHRAVRELVLLMNDDRATVQAAALELVDGLQPELRAAPIQAAVVSRNISLRLKAIAKIQSSEDERLSRWLLRQLDSQHDEIVCAASRAYAHFFDEEEAFAIRKYLSVEPLIRLAQRPLQPSPPSDTATAESHANPTPPKPRLGSASPTQTLGPASPTQKLGSASPTQQLGSAPPTQTLDPASAKPHLISIPPESYLDSTSPKSHLDSASKAGVVCAIGALGHSEHYRAMGVLLSRLRSDDDDIRLAAAGALGLLKDKAAVPDLTARFADWGETPAVRAAALVAVKQADHNTDVHTMLVGARQEATTAPQRKALQAVIDYAYYRDPNRIIVQPALEGLKGPAPAQTDTTAAGVTSAGAAPAGVVSYIPSAQECRKHLFGTGAVSRRGRGNRNAAHTNVSKSKASRRGLDEGGLDDGAFASCLRSDGLIIKRPPRLDDMADEPGNINVALLAAVSGRSELWAIDLVQALLSDERTPVSHKRVIIDSLPQPVNPGTVKFLRAMFDKDRNSPLAPILASKLIDSDDGSALEWARQMFANALAAANDDKAMAWAQALVAHSPDHVLDLLTIKPIAPAPTNETTNASNASTHPPPDSPTDEQGTSSGAQR